jgi:hypothetical protein
MALSSGARLGPYEILGAIGAGGMDEVYRAKDTRLGRTVALKILPPDVAADPGRRRRFEQEAPAASVLDHPHICVLHDIGADLPVFETSAWALDVRRTRYACLWCGHDDGSGSRDPIALDTREAVSILSV